MDNCTLQLALVALVVAVASGTFAGVICYKEGQYAGRRAERACHGTDVEAHVSKGADGKYGVAVGECRPTAFNADWITTGGDRHVTRDDAVALVLKYWPLAYIYDPEADVTIQRSGGVPD